MIDLDKLNKKVRDAVKTSTITDTDQLNDIVNQLFPTDSQLKSTIDHLHTIKPFTTKSKEFITEMVKSKVRDALFREAYTEYQSNKNKSKFSIEEIEEELNDYYDDFDGEIDNES